ncbi:MAG: hypothetical protein ACKOKG_14175 [Verrucomicrobiota bacterium]
MIHPSPIGLSGFIGALGLVAHLAAAPVSIPIPNGSFEWPSTEFVSTRIDRWQEFAATPTYSEAGGFAWDQLTGLFRNTAPGAGDHLSNLDGRQALYLFAIPGVGLFQDGMSRDWDDPEPTRDFTVRFAPGSTYTLGARVQGGGGGMREGVSLELCLYYRNASGGQVDVARTEVIHSGAVFSDRQRLLPISVTTAPVQATDAWAGQSVGIRLRSTVASELAGGYWDVDEITLDRQAAHALQLEWSWDTDSSPKRLRIAWASETNRAYRVESSIDGTSWTVRTDPIQGTGERLSWSVDTEQSGSLWLRVVATSGS